jgi:hypothetical protein
MDSGFGTTAYRQLPANIAMDLRMGMRFSGDTATSVRTAVKAACDLIQKMPAHYITFDDGRQVFQINRGAAVRMRGDVIIDEVFLWSFGTLTMPRHIWLSMMRFSAWIEPALVWEWQKLSNSYAQSQGRILDPHILSQAARWMDAYNGWWREHEPILVVCMPKTDRCTVCGAANALPSDRRRPRLAVGSLPCADLWNLVPADRHHQPTPKA